jgi:hypothetical protein
MSFWLLIAALCAADLLAKPDLFTDHASALNAPFARAAGNTLTGGASWSGFRLFAIGRFLFCTRVVPVERSIVLYLWTMQPKKGDGRPPAAPCSRRAGSRSAGYIVHHRFCAAVGRRVYIQHNRDPSV